MSEMDIVVAIAAINAEIRVAMDTRFPDWEITSMTLRAQERDTLLEVIYDVDADAKVGHEKLETTWAAGPGGRPFLISETHRFV